MASETPERILELLTENNSPLSASNIALQLGFSQARNVNPSLYKLKRKGLIKQMTGTPPLWTLGTKLKDTSAENQGSPEGIEHIQEVDTDLDYPSLQIKLEMDPCMRSDTVMQQGSEDLPQIDVPVQSDSSDNYNMNYTQKLGLYSPTSAHGAATAECALDSPKSKTLHDEDLAPLQIIKKIKLDPDAEFHGHTADSDSGRTSASPAFNFANATQVDGPQYNFTDSKPSTIQAKLKNDLQEKIYRFLSGSNGKKQSAQRIAHAVGFLRKKDINRDLYSLAKSGLIAKVQDSPPIWQVCSVPAETTSVQAVNQIEHLQIQDDAASSMEVGPEDSRPEEFSHDISGKTSFRAVNVPGFSLGTSQVHAGHMNPGRSRPSLRGLSSTRGRGRGLMMFDALKGNQSNSPPGMKTGKEAATGFKIPANPLELLEGNTVFNGSVSSQSKPSLLQDSGSSTSHTVPSLMSQTIYPRGLAPGSYPSNKVADPPACSAQTDTIEISDTQSGGFTTSGHSSVSFKPQIPSIFDSPTPDISPPVNDSIHDPQQKSLMAALKPPSSSQRSVNTSFSLTPRSSIPPSPRTLLNINRTVEPVIAPADPGASAAQINMASPVSISADAFKALNKNSVSALMEYAQARKSTATIEVVGQRGPPHKPVFTVAAFIGKRKFPSVQCSNKKEGRTEAADIALRTLMAEGEYKVQQQTDSVIMSVSSGNSTHFDRMAALAHVTFNKLAVHVAETMSGRKILAALIMQRGAGDRGSVISLGTGNRCITGNFMSLEGQTINDSHAEIITRRGFIRFLYGQLRTYVPGDSNSILEQGHGGLLKVKDNVTFHLYISTAPCGDGALFSPRDSHSAKMVCDDSRQAHQPVFSSKVQGVLRTKMEGGEGTIPIEAGFKGQTWDGILRGERLRTMSCSDKICRWNIVGMQGALLSHFLEPVYLDSLTLGLLYDHGHLSRAVCCRLSHGDPDLAQELPPPYHINHPRLGRVTVCDASRETQKTKEYSINWCEGDPKAEVLDGTKGICVGVKSLDEQVSRVSKSALFEHFKSTCRKFNRHDLLSFQTYGETKQKALHFQQVKQMMMTKFKVRGYGPWVSKPMEEEMF